MICLTLMLLGEMLSAWPSSAYKLSLDATIWRAEAATHRREMLSLLYPPPSHHGEDLKSRRHAVDSHPIFNFIHTYYRYSISKVLAYSPGLGTQIQLEGVKASDLYFKPSDSRVTQESTSGFLSPYGLIFEEDSGVAYYDGATFVKEKEAQKLQEFLSILTETSMRPPMFSCYGLHEWAMLYSGRRNSQSPELGSKHQKTPLRVTQEIIDDLVEGKQAGCTLMCTHFDAYRFFHPSSQELNVINDLSRKTQAKYEQGGCIHATMDLFKFAYTLYPFCSSTLLRKTLRLALAARKIDMRSSPYDVSKYLPEEEREPIRVEIAEGRKQFAVEQESLFHRSMPIRAELIVAYNEHLESIGYERDKNSFV